MRQKYLVSVLFILFALAAPVLCFAQSDVEQNGQNLVPGECWSNYSECASAAFGDEGWRSSCYADFSRCVGKQELAQCDLEKLPQACSDYASECMEIAADDAVTGKQCKADLDVCYYALGC
jgi:hypothetical protein